MIPAGAVQRKTVPPQMHKIKHWRRNKMNRPSVGARQLLSSPEGLHCCRKLFRDSDAMQVELLFHGGAPWQKKEIIMRFSAFKRDAPTTN